MCVQFPNAHRLGSFYGDPILCFPFVNPQTCSFQYRALRKGFSSLNICAVSTKLCVTNVRKLVCTHDLKILFSIFCTLRKDFPKTHMQQGQSQDPSSYNIKTQFRLNLAGNTQKVRGKLLPLGQSLSLNRFMWL